MGDERKAWRGVFPAVLVPFHDDYTIDELALRRLLRWVAGHDGLGGVVVNGHTGEVGSLLPHERAQVVRIAVDEVGGTLPVISGVCAEGTHEAVEHATAVEKAGGAGILLMPPHSWLRFGMQPDAPREHFRWVAESVGISIFVHQYPKHTKATYHTDQLLEIVSIPSVEAVKIGTREIAQYELDVRALKEHAPECSILTCHDEYLLATLVQGVDGALVGLACLAPDHVVALVRAVERADLGEAVKWSERLFPLKQAVYRTGEPSAVAHARMKQAMHERGIIPSPLARPPVTPLSDEEKAHIRRAVTLSSSSLEGT